MSLLNPKYISAVDLDEVLSVLGKEHVKKSGEAETSYLTGRLYVSRTGWLLLSVPNALARGAFDALNELGVELPISESLGAFNAHISVMRPEELEQLGGLEKITERGHSFKYTLGKVKTAEPDGWDEISRVWMIEVHSPELQNLRKSYGLSPLPKYPFHITIGVRKKRVLQNSEISKAGGIDEIQSKVGI